MNFFIVILGEKLLKFDVKSKKRKFLPAIVSSLILSEARKFSTETF